jgi:hypothetical protein
MAFTFRIPVVHSRSLTQAVAKSSKLPPYRCVYPTELVTCMLQGQSMDPVPRLSKIKSFSDLPPSDGRLAASPMVTTRPNAASVFACGHLIQPRLSGSRIRSDPISVQLAPGAFTAVSSDDPILPRTADQGPGIEWKTIASHGTYPYHPCSNRQSRMQGSYYLGI